jgi:hypothetical protein
MKVINTSFIIILRTIFTMVFSFRYFLHIPAIWSGSTLFVFRFIRYFWPRSQWSRSSLNCTDYIYTGWTWDINHIPWGYHPYPMGISPKSVGISPKSVGISPKKYHGNITYIPWDITQTHGNITHIPWGYHPYIKGISHISHGDITHISRG